jgi:hypothetical protein
MEHFGEPLVNSTTDFGARSEPPLHRELLDWLAADFVRSGWSVKHLHRVILLSSGYQQTSGSTKDQGQGGKGVSADAENKLLWHYPRRRLDFEAMRDSLLLASGRLDLKMGGPSVDVANDPMNQRRTVYALVDRQNLPGMFRAFDFPVPDQCVERRAHTAVPQQTLFGLNSPFVMEQAKALAERVNPRITGTQKPELTVDMLFQRVLERHATKEEVVSCRRFLEAAKNEKLPEKGLEPLEQLAQVLLISNEALFLD